jgi:hypothetical protein
MKSIKQQYIDLTEGKMSQTNFMRNLRMTIPQYVTNVTSFKDAVRILKNKGILTEGTFNERVKEPSEYASFFDPYAEEAEYTARFDSFKERLYKELEYIAEEKNEPNLIPFYKKYENTEAIEKIIRFYLKDNEGGPWKAARDIFEIEYIGSEESEPDNISEAKKAKLTADQVNNDELRMGIRVEMEHTDDSEKAKKIALDHLAENPFYYTQLKLSGVDTRALPSKEYKAIAKKKDETEVVDKANQMKPVKGVEKVKASANKAKKETNKPEKGIKMMSLVSKTVRGVKKMDATGEKVKTIKEAEEKKPEEKKNVAKTIFDKNANITKGINKIAGIEEKLREAIRKMIKQEMYDGMEPMDRTGLDEASSSVGLKKQHQDQISDLSSEQKKKLYDDLTDATTEVNDRDFSTKAEYAKAMKDAKIAVYKKYIKY